MSRPNMQLDHVILLVPYKYLSDPPDWLAKNFIISPGGRHADGKTENRLVLFRDGTYLEVIAFIDDDPERRKGHWWNVPYGIVDYALTTPDKHLEYDSLISRLEKRGSKISYDKPHAGGRTKPDGTDVKWEVTFPTHTERGSVPFFCHDVTPRDRRVPITDESTNHPCGALGMGGMLANIGTDRIGELGTAITAIVDGQSDAKGRIEIGAVNKVKGLSPPSLRLEESSSKQDLSLNLVLQVPEKKLPEDIRHEVGDGVVSISFER